MWCWFVLFWCEEEEPGTGSAGARDRAPTVELEVVNNQSKPEKDRR